MKRAIQKLHSNRGVSLLLALVLVLMAVMVSAVIVSAAVTAASRVQNDVRQEQEILSLNSGAKAMAAYLDDAGEYVYYETVPKKAEYADQSESGENSSSAIMAYFESQLNGSARSFSLTAAVSVPGELTGAADAFQNATMDLTVGEASISEESDGDEVSDDNQVVTTTTTYPITGTVHSGAAGSEGVQKIYVSFAVIKTVTVNPLDTIEVLVEETFDNPDFNPEMEAGPDNPPEITDSKPKTVSATTTTTSWYLSALELSTSEPKALTVSGSEET